MRAEAKRWAVPVGLSLWCVSLVVLRVELSGSLMYVFLCWNLWLAWIPWVAGQAFRTASRRRASAARQLGWLALWMLFLPNAPYITTDLLHLGPRPFVPLWYDLALLLSCAGTGLLLGYMSLIDVQGAVEERFGRVRGWAVAAGSLFLSGFGIYLGRFLRWNSWDVLTDPAGLFHDISVRLLDPTAHRRAYGVTLIFGGGLLLGYAALRSLVAPSLRPCPPETSPTPRLRRGHPGGWRRAFLSGIAFLRQLTGGTAHDRSDLDWRDGTPAHPRGRFRPRYRPPAPRPLR